VVSFVSSGNDWELLWSSSPSACKPKEHKSCQVQATEIAYLLSPIWGPMEPLVSFGTGADDEWVLLATKRV